MDILNAYNSFFGQYNGKQVEKEDSTALYQCMDLAFAWCDALSVDRATIRHAMAYQVWSQPTDIGVQFFEFIPNTPNGIPKTGDMIIFNQQVGSAGHISIRSSGSADTNSFQSFDQNWNGIQKAVLVSHSYTGVDGWLRLRQPTTNDLATLQGQIKTLQGKIDSAKSALA